MSARRAELKARLAAAPNDRARLTIALAEVERVERVERRWADQNARLLVARNEARAERDALREQSEPKMTDRQARAFKETVADIRSRGIRIDDDLGFYTWHVRWHPESRPGRGRFMSAVWCDGEHLVQVTMDVYGGPTVSIADVDWAHTDSDDQCGCERCADERERQDRTDAAGGR